jgi:GMP synthase (glutamine-hydrolysing)
MPLPSPNSAREIIPILDFGSQYAQLIARRVRETGVYSELVRHDIPVADLLALRPKGVILSGGPSSVYEANAPRPDPKLFESLFAAGIPVLGICYGMQLGAELLGGKVRPGKAREFGSAKLTLSAAKGHDALTRGLPAETTVWMSHGDQVHDLPADWIPLATTPTCPYAAAKHATQPFYGVQFHPEVTHTPRGEILFHNFLYHICKCTKSWTMGKVRAQLAKYPADTKVICGLSGGVDSSVVAALLHKAIGDQLVCIFVDNGLLRNGERTMVEQTFRDAFNIHLIVSDASEQFLSALRDVKDPQQKRKIIGREFIDAFKREAQKIPSAHLLAQGTLYPDVIESGHGHSGPGGTAANIKLHHNVGGLPEQLGFELVEPLRELFKDEVRALGEVLGLPEHIIWRHPFPGPGLAVRIIGDITPERLRVLRDADEIVLEELIAANLYRSTSQVFAVLLPIGTVGVMGDARTYDAVCAIRAVESKDFMTADWARIPFNVLATMSNRIVNEVKGISRVVYDISTKPPATIEWE